MAEKKTIVAQFAEVKEVLEGVGRADLAEFIEGRIAVQAKKAENRKPTAKQVANEGLKVRVKEVLAEAENGMTATEILNADVEAFGNVQKVTALLTAMVKAGEVVKAVDKKKAVFTLAE